ncbi:hypothetical protein VSQ48_21585 [Candidatus Ventrimonas sp. KK005]|nr:hypothetical protein [Lachnospiraceae bacterium]
MGDPDFLFGKIGNFFRRHNDFFDKTEGFSCANRQKRHDRREGLVYNGENRRMKSKKFDKTFTA